jgi:hypothetical protein
VRVYEDYIDVKDSKNQTKASLRVICYLEDNGISKSSKPGSSLKQARELAKNGPAINSEGQIDY